MIKTFDDPYSYAPGYYEKDHQLWPEFFQVVDSLFGKDSKVFQALRLFRQSGITLKREKKSFVLRPLFDPHGKYTIWKNIEEYNELKNKYLLPFRNEIVQALEKFTEYIELKKKLDSFLGREIVTPYGDGILKRITPYGAEILISGLEKIIDIKECEPF